MVNPLVLDSAPPEVRHLAMEKRMPDADFDKDASLKLEVRHIEKFDRQSYVGRFESWYGCETNPKSPLVVDGAPSWDAEHNAWAISARYRWREA